MHSLTKITPLNRKKIYTEYTEILKSSKGKKKEACYRALAKEYKVHSNTIRKIIDRGKNGDFTVHKSTTRGNEGYEFRAFLRITHKKLIKILTHEPIIRYEKEMAGEMVHIDLHKMKNIKGEDPKKKKYWAGVIDDATRLVYSEVIPNKKAETVCCFMRRAHTFFLQKGIKIQRLLSDNGLEFTTRHITARPQHRFEKLLLELGIIHKYTRVRRPQTNGKIERWWRIINEDFFYKHQFTSLGDFLDKFKDWLVYYNLKRPHGGIQMMTPIQKLEKLLAEGKVCI